MARFRSFAIAAAVASALGADTAAQVTLTMGKSGNDIVLNWVGGSGTYNVIRSSAYRMSANTEFIQTGSINFTFTDAGVLFPDDQPPLYCYVVSDVAVTPSLNISMPCDSPPLLCPSPVTARTTDVSGSTNSPTPVFVNDLQATTTAGSFTVTGVPLLLDINTITAATRNAAGDWSIDKIQLNRTNGNQSPTISIATPADGTTIYDSTPFVEVDYSDPEGSLNTGDLKIYLDGTLKTAFTVTSTKATYQLTPAEALTAGTHYIYATIRDTAPHGASAVSSFELSNPVITSFSPAAEGKIGDTVTGLPPENWSISV
jgi:hypothetical protein